MKKVILTFVLSITVFVVFGCYRSEIETAYWSFDYSSTEIKEIKVVELNDSYSDYRDFDNVICSIDSSKVDSLYEDVLKMEWQKREAKNEKPKGFCLLFIYKNDDADMISCSGPVKYRMDDGKMIMLDSNFYMDDYDENFVGLIIKHLVW